MDIFVDVLLKHYKELTWMSISAELGCPASESKKLLVDTVKAALNATDIPKDASIQCVFNGPAPGNPSTRQLVQTQAVKDNWPPKSYLASVYGEGSEPDVCLQTVWLAASNLEMDKALVATDDLFHDLYSKAQRSASQDILYIAPFSQTIMSKLKARWDAGNVCRGSSIGISAISDQSKSKVVPIDLLEPKVEAQKTKEEKLPASPVKELEPTTPVKPAAKRRRNHLRGGRLQERTISPVVALGLTASPTMGDSRAAEPSFDPLPDPDPSAKEMDETQMGESIITVKPATSLFTAEDVIDDGPPQRSPEQSPDHRESRAKNSPQITLPTQTSGRSKTTIETSSKGGLTFGKAQDSQVATNARSSTRKASGGNTLDAFFRKG